MGKRCIFHIPCQLDPNRASASQIRPMKMKKAFEEIGYTVDLVQGYGKERKKQIADIKENIKRGVRYEFLYSESSTMPTLLTERHHFPTYPFLDFGFLKYVKKQGIKVGLFYRDMYWKFPQYKEDVKGIKYCVAVFMYRYDLRQYKKILDKLYLATKKAYKYLRKEVPADIVGVLPPGCENSMFCSKEMSGDKMTLLYVGGLGAHYQIHKVLKAVSEVPKIELILCCRAEEWERESIHYVDYLRDNIHVFHESGDGLGMLYKKADIGLAFFEHNTYMDMAMPYKVFEYLGHGLPVIASSGTAAGDFVQKEDAGWTAEYSADGLKQLLLSLLDDKNAVLEKREAVRVIIRKHTWAQRAKKVERDLLIR